MALYKGSIRMNEGMNEWMKGTNNGATGKITSTGGDIH